MINLEQLVSGGYRNRLFWVLQCAGWLAAGLLVFVFSGVSFLDWDQALWLALIRTAFGFLATCMLRLTYRRMKEKALSLRETIVRVVLITGTVAVLDAVLTLNLGNLVVANRVEEFGNFLQASVLMRLMLYWFWSVLYFGINYWLDTQRVQLELAEAEAAAQTSELKALRAQINPHFLFNALGSILAESGNAAHVRELTLALSDYLRFSLQDHRELEPLKSELDALENYLKVERTRFGENLEFRIAASREARDTPVLPALIQPLLENAIKYGQRSNVRPLRLTIEAFVEEGFLVLRVRNTGEWVPPDSNVSTKTGLANLRRRLELIYGQDGVLRVGDAAGEVVATVRLPAPASGARAATPPCPQAEGV